MDELTNKQLKNRWAEIKKLIKERPLLAYRVQIPLDEWDKYMHSFPTESEINRIYLAIQEDRKKKTLRIKENLSKIVGYRESKEFSRRTRVSDTSIREILEGKKEMAGYDVINRLEVFLNAIVPNFELSIENPLTTKNYTEETISEITTNLYRVAENIKQSSHRLSELVRKGEIETDLLGREIKPTYYLNLYIERLTELKSEIDIFWETYIDKKER